MRQGPLFAALLALFSLNCAAADQPRQRSTPDEEDAGLPANGGASGSGGRGGGGSGGGGAGGAGTGGSGTGGSPTDAALAATLDSAADMSIDAGMTARDTGGDVSMAKFSFFVTSIEAIRALSKSQNGFGGNYGGLAGADSICQGTAERVGFGHKTWRAFLSATKGPNGTPVHAIDRIGTGPWFDKLGRLIAMNRQDLVMVRPSGDGLATTDLPNETGVPQKPFGDNHDVITGSNRMGMLQSTNAADTCNDWTSASATGGGRPMCGHSWSRTGRQQWIQEHTVPGCAPGVNLRDNSVMQGNCIGCNGGYGAIYCFALTP